MHGYIHIYLYLYLFMIKRIEDKPYQYVNSNIDPHGYFDRLSYGFLFEELEGVG